MHVPGRLLRLTRLLPGAELPPGPARIYEVFPLRCPYCGADARILAFPAEPEPVPEFDDVDPDPDGPA